MRLHEGLEGGLVTAAGILLASGSVATAEQLEGGVATHTMLGAHITLGGAIHMCDVYILVISEIL